MRIISGKFRGRKIDFISEEKTRPTAEVVRQALFTKLQFEFPMENCLDLFAGSGSLGLEALSRGAKHVYFVELNRQNVKIVENNLTAFKVEFDRNNFNTSKEASVINCDYAAALNSFNNKFDLILIDPPYESGFYEKALNIIKERNLLSENGIIVLEHDESKNFTNLPFEIIDEKKYGRKKLTYLINS